MDNFTLGANLAYLHARYTDFCADTNGVFTDGSPEPGPCGPAVPILINGVPHGTFAVPTASTGLQLATAPEWRGRVSAAYVILVGFGGTTLDGTTVVLGPRGVVRVVLAGSRSIKNK